MNRFVVLICALFVASSPCFGQIEEIVVTGSRISEYGDTPAVTLQRQADFLTQSIQLVNDSRSPDLRRKEIIQTIKNLMDSARKQAGIELSYGDGFLLPINLDDDSLQIIEDQRRADTSHVDIYVKVKFQPNAAPAGQISELRKFIESARKDGRTEIDSLGDVGVSIVKPEQYRYDIVARISEEAKNLRGVVDSSCKVSITGLQSRVSWERTGVADLLLYIPYSIQVKDCAY